MNLDLKNMLMRIQIEIPFHIQQSFFSCYMGTHNYRNLQLPPTCGWTNGNSEKNQCWISFVELKQPCPEVCTLLSATLFMMLNQHLKINSYKSLHRQIQIMFVEEKCRVRWAKVKSSSTEKCLFLWKHSISSPVFKSVFIQTLLSAKCTYVSKALQQNNPSESYVILWDHYYWCINLWVAS